MPTSTQFADFLYDNIESFPLTALEFVQELSFINEEAPKLRSYFQNTYNTVSSSHSTPSAPVTKSTNNTATTSSPDLILLSSIKNYLDSQGLSLAALTLSQEVSGSLPPAPLLTELIETAKKPTESQLKSSEITSQEDIIEPPFELLISLTSTNIGLDVRKFIINLYMNSQSFKSPENFINTAIILLCSSPDFVSSDLFFDFLESKFEHFSLFVDDPFSTLYEVISSKITISDPNLLDCYSKALVLFYLSDTYFIKALHYILNLNELHIAQKFSILTLLLSKRPPQEHDFAVFDNAFSDVISRHILSDIQPEFINSLCGFIERYLQCFPCPSNLSSFLKSLFGAFLEKSNCEVPKATIVDNIDTILKHGAALTEPLFSLITTSIIPRIVQLKAMSTTSAWDNVMLLTSSRNSSFSDCFSKEIRKAMMNSNLTIKESLLPFFIIHYDSTSTFLSSLFKSMMQGDDGWALEDFPSIEATLEAIVSFNSANLLHTMMQNLCGMVVEGSDVSGVALNCVLFLCRHPFIVTRYSGKLFDIVTQCFSSSDTAITNLAGRIIAAMCFVESTSCRALEVINVLTNGEILPTDPIKGLLSEVTVILDSITSSDDATVHQDHVVHITSQLLIPLFKNCLRKPFAHSETTASLVVNYIVVILTYLCGFKPVLGQELCAEVVGILNGISETKLLVNDARLNELKSTFQDSSKKSASVFLKKMKKEMNIGKGARSLKKLSMKKSSR
ncbi:hypothetical protein P9112_008217 [Eukaryota sp. TZLM1-RC]